MNKFYKSPLSYCGNKFDLLQHLLPLFPDGINKFIDLFCGGLDISLNVKADKKYSNDIMFPFIDLYKALQSNEITEIMKRTDFILKNGYGQDKESFKAFKKLYSEERNPIDLFLLTKCSFSNLARFNAKHEYNQSFGSKLTETKASTIIEFADKIKKSQITFSSGNFTDFDFDKLDENDFVYCDPPYLITIGVYQDGKRGFEGWNDEYEHKLYAILEELNSRHIKFGLSNVIEHKGNTNTILKDFINDNKLHEFHFYKNVRGYSDRDEVFICNYEPKQQKQLTLFSNE